MTIVTEDSSVNPYGSPPTTEAAVTTKIPPPSILSSVLIRVPFSVVLGFGLLVLFGMAGRAMGIAMFESNPNDSFEAEYGAALACSRHIVRFMVSFALMGLFTGVALPWIHLLYSLRRRKTVVAKFIHERE